MIFRDLTPPSYQIENGIDWDVTCNQQTQRKILRQSDFFWKTLEVLDQEKMPILTKMTWGLPVSPNRCQSPHQKMIQKYQKMMVEATVAGVHSESNLLFAVGDLTMAKWATNSNPQKADVFFEVTI